MAKKKKTKKKNNKKKISFKFLVFSVLFIALLILFLPTAFLLAVGLLPTFVAAVVDHEPGKNKTFTIGAMNFAGCFPYLLQVWMTSDSMEKALILLTEPNTIIVMYGAAALGYAINTLVTMGISFLLVQRSQLRLQKIETEKKALEERWGVKVNGDYDLDEHGFPIDTEDREIDAQIATS